LNRLIGKFKSIDDLAISLNFEIWGWNWDWKENDYRRRYL